MLHDTYCTVGAVLPAPVPVPAVLPLPVPQQPGEGPASPRPLVLQRVEGSPQQATTIQSIKLRPSYWKRTLLEKFWRISLFVTDDAIA